ncbi:MAG: Tetratricopeptide 4 [Candidatus Solibacter sp.]|nr:Tetratricopeptide 4 [Candidatus Solibacter sp.]
MRGALFLLIACTAPSQVRYEDPLQAKLNAIYKAREAGRFVEAAALREDARRMLEGLPPATPAYAGSAHAIARLYESGARTAQARAVLQHALDRAGNSPAYTSVRIAMLAALSDSWFQDRNLKNALEYMQKAVAAQEAAPPPAPSGPPARQLDVSAVVFTGLRAQRVRFSSFTLADSNLNNYYNRLAALERQLGHPDAAAVWNGKLRVQAAKRGDSELASFLEQQGELAEAAAIRKRAAERAVTPEDAVEQLGSLARIYVRQERLDEAIAAQQQAIGRMEAPGSAEREQLAQMLQRAGRTDQADVVYRELLTQTPADQQVWLTVRYSNYLSSSQRGAQAVALLGAFRESHGALRPDEEAGVYFALAHAAQVSGDVRKSEEYQARGAAINKRQSPNVPAPPELDSLLRQAEAAAGEGKTADAFAAAMRALHLAPAAQNRDLIGWIIPSIASAMTQHKAVAPGELLFQHAIALAESWSDETLQPLLNLLGNRAHFLMGQPELKSQTPALIERYRALLIEAHGADSGMLDDPMRMTVQFERTRNAPPASMIPVQDLLAYEESVNGNTSEPYLAALRTLAETYDYNGDRMRAIPVRRQIVQIADLGLPKEDPQRGQVRVDLAMALANDGDFDEADQVVAQAPRQPYALQQIRRMRAERQRPR